MKDFSDVVISRDAGEACYLVPFGNRIFFRKVVTAVANSFHPAANIISKVKFSFTPKTFEEPLQVLGIFF